jgi:hypothetical protein
MEKLDTNEKFIDQVIAFAAAKHAENIAASSAEDAKKHVFSENFGKKMDALIEREKRRDTGKVFRKWGLRAAVFFVALLAVATVTVYSVEALRVPVVNFFTEWGDQSISIQAQPAEMSYAEYAEKIHGRYLPAYIPVGYHVNDITLDSVEYTDKNNNSIIFKILGDTFSAEIDSEGAQYEESEVNGKPARYYFTKGMAHLIFEYGGIQFLLTTGFDKPETIKIAESLRYYK